MILSMLIFLGLSLPVAVAIGLASLVGVAAGDHLPWLVVPQQLYAALDKYPLVAIPFFILAGNLMEAGGISTRLVDLAKSLVGGVRGGLALACVLTSMVFAALSGSSVATTFAVGAILIPALIRHGHPAPFAASLQASSAELGVIIPPSIPLILYAVSTNTSTGEIFLAGVGPGLLIAGGLMVYVWFYAHRQGQGGQDGVARLAWWPALRRAWLALLMPAIILGGICRPGPPAAAGGPELWRRPGAFRYHHGRQPGPGHDHATLWRQPLRRRGHRRPAPGAAGAALATLRGGGGCLPADHHLCAGTKPGPARPGLSALSGICCTAPERPYLLPFRMGMRQCPSPLAAARDAVGLQWKTEGAVRNGGRPAQEAGVKGPPPTT